MLFFVDDTEFELEGSPKKNCVCLGGILLRPADVAAAERILSEIKREHGIPDRLPIKWNMKDTLVKRSYCEALGEEHYKKILSEESNKIRGDLIQRISSLNITILFSLHSYVGHANKKTCIEFCFINLLQRYAFVLKKENAMRPDNEWLHLIIMDRANTETMNAYCEVFDDAYRKGEGFFAGPLSAFSVPGICYSVTAWNPLLQITDVFVGCIAHFLQHSLKGKASSPEFTALASHALRRINAHPANGDILGYGLVVPRGFPGKDKIVSRLSSLVLS